MNPFFKCPSKPKMAQRFVVAMVRNYHDSLFLLGASVHFTIFVDKNKLEILIWNHT
jgi:hypothetical protein